MMAEALKTSHYNELHVADITPWLQSQGDNYDLILAADVLEYFGDLNDLFAATRRRLNDNSRFAFSVEASESPEYTLTVSGRYAHHADYIAECATKSGLKIDSLSRETLRLEYAKPVSGLIVVRSAA